MAGNPYQRPGFKDPREAALEPASSLSSYFQDQADKKPKTVTPYSAPAEPAGGPAPMGGGSAPSAPKGSAGGGTGFVSFGQYFGANAPAIQQQAQGVVGKTAAPTIPQGAPGLGTFKTASFGPMPTSGTMAQRLAAGLSAKNSYAAQIAQTSAQMEALNPAAQSGDMGENVSAFDQLLGGGVTQRAAKQEQQRLGTLRAALEGQQNQWTAEQAARKEAQDRQQAQSAKTRQQEQEQAQRTQEAATNAAKDRAWKDLANPFVAMFHSRDSWWNSLSDAEKQKYLDQTTTGRGTGQFGESEYGSVSQ
jgi:hypothetical protein